jgi:hypothetical protein
VAEEGAVAEVARLVGELERDVVFAMSLGSKELFHSNLLGCTWSASRA